MAHYINTNAAYQNLEALIEKNVGMHDSVIRFMKAVGEERDATQKEIASLRHESEIKAYYIQQLEKVKCVHHTPTEEVLEKIERDLLRLLNSATDALADVTKLRTSR